MMTSFSIILHFQLEPENRIRGFILEKGMPGLTAPKVIMFDNICYGLFNLTSLSS